VFQSEFLKISGLAWPVRTGCLVAASCGCMDVFVIVDIQRDDSLWSLQPPLPATGLAQTNVASASMTHGSHCVGFFSDAPHPKKNLIQK
jgi:hypothetical protein